MFPAGCNGSSFEDAAVNLSDIDSLIPDILSCALIRSYLTILMFFVTEARFDDKYLHLGAYDYHANGIFKWLSTTTPVDLGDAFWLPNNPRGQGRRCMAFQTWDMDFFGQWADEFCWVSLPFICEVVTAPSFV